MTLLINDAPFCDAVVVESTIMHLHYGILHSFDEKSEVWKVAMESKKLCKVPKATTDEASIYAAESTQCSLIQ